MDDRADFVRKWLTVLLEYFDSSAEGVDRELVVVVRLLHIDLVVPCQNEGCPEVSITVGRLILFCYCTQFAAFCLEDWTEVVVGVGEFA